MNNNQKNVIKIYFLILPGTFVIFAFFFPSALDLDQEMQKTEPSYLGLVTEWFRVRRGGQPLTFYITN